MIYQLKELVAVEPLLRLIKKKEEMFDIPLKDIAEYLLEAITDKDSIVLIDEKDKEIRGVLYASIEKWDNKDVAFIHLCVIDPKQKNTGFEFLARLNKWGKMKGIEKMIMSTKRPEAFQRKYKFKYVSTILTRAIGG